MTFSLETCNDIEAIRHVALELTGQFSSLEESNISQSRRIERLEQENEYLQERLRILLHQRYGRQSETLKALQIDLFDTTEALEQIAEEQAAKQDLKQDIEVKAHKKKHKVGRPKLPSHLERRIQIETLPDSELTCPNDGHALQPMKLVPGGEKLIHIPEDYYVIQIMRQQYSCPSCHKKVKLAPVPLSPIPKSIATPSLLSSIIHNKFVMFAPLYRQSQDLKRRTGIEISRSAMAKWIIQVSMLIQPLVNLLMDTLLESDYIHADETRAQVLKELGRRASALSWIWVYHTSQNEKPVALYHYHHSRAGYVVKEHLEGYQGYLQCDGYQVYEGISNEITLLGCWAHLRRKFADTLKGLDKNDTIRRGHAEEALNMIAQLYKIESECDQQNFSPHQRKLWRQQHSKPILDQFRCWLEDRLHASPVRGHLGKAITYGVNQWEKLIVFLQDGRLRLDNNVDEQRVRPWAQGRRNWLFSDTPAGATANTNLFSLLQTAMLNGLEPKAYIEYVLEETPKIEQSEDVAEYENLLPWNCEDQVKRILTH